MASSIYFELTEQLIRRPFDIGNAHPPASTAAAAVRQPPKVPRRVVHIPLPGSGTLAIIFCTFASVVHRSVLVGIDFCCQPSDGFGPALSPQTSPSPRQAPEGHTQANQQRSAGVSHPLGTLAPTSPSRSQARLAAAGHKGRGLSRSPTDGCAN